MLTKINLLTSFWMKGVNMENKDKFELAVNAGLQAIPYVGGPLATLYFGYKQEKRFTRIEQTLKELADELNGINMPSIEMHNKDELIDLIDELTDKIENEHLEYKRQLYKRYFKNILITPTNGNYEERNLFLTILSQITPLQIELFQFIMKNCNVIDLQITKPGTDISLIRSSILQLENIGLVVATLHSISLGGSNSGMPMMLNCSEFGKRFNSFCLED